MSNKPIIPTTYSGLTAAQLYKIYRRKLDRLVYVRQISDRIKEKEVLAELKQIEELIKSS